jgi:hypothetical protein
MPEAPRSGSTADELHERDLQMALAALASDELYDALYGEAL